MYYFSCKKRFRLRKKWKDEFGGDLYFFHGSSNSWGVLIVFYGNQDITVKKVVWQKRTSTCFRWTDWRLWFFALKYNPNADKEQVSVLNELITILSNFENSHNHNVIFAGDFNIFFDASLDAKGGTPTLKSWFINKLIELNKTFDLRDIRRIRNPKKRK